MNKIRIFIKKYLELSILIGVVVIALIVFICQNVNGSKTETKSNVDYNLIYLHNY